MRVVDGDTVVLRSAGKSRLIGVDAPEVFGGQECFGREASAFAKRLLRPGIRVRVERDVEERDRYGRTLIYLRLPDRRSLGSHGDRNTGADGERAGDCPRRLMGCASVGAEASP